MAEVRDVSSLPIGAELIDLLHVHGFRVLHDLQGIKPLNLAQELKISPSQAMKIIQQVKASLSTPSTGNLAETSNNNDESILSHQPTLFTQTSTTISTRSTTYDTTFSAKDLVARMSLTKPIITFCKALDVMLGGGIPMGHVTEICGVPGIGKTQLLCQLALNVQIPELFHGQGGECLFIDTEGSFFPERVQDMAQELSKHLMKLAAHHAAPYKSSSGASTNSRPISDPAYPPVILAQLQAAEAMTTQRFLNGIHVQRCHDLSDFQLFLHSLPTYLSLHPKIKLIAIDSIAFPFRSSHGLGGATPHHNHPNVPPNSVSTSSSSSFSSGQSTERQRQLAFLAQQVTEWAFQFRCAVVVTNHVTTKISSSAVTPTPSDDDGVAAATGVSQTTSSLVPALGDTWAHAIGTRLLLHYNNTPTLSSSSGKPFRIATLLKSPSMPLQSQVFLVNKKGVRDVPQAAVSAGHTETRPMNGHVSSENSNQTIEAYGRATVSQMDQIIGSKRSYATL